MERGNTIRGIVELAGEFDPELQAKLVFCAYRKSRSDVDALVFRGIERPESGDRPLTRSDARKAPLQRCRREVDHRRNGSGNRQPGSA